MSEIVWIHAWQDDGTLTADDKFAVALADRDEVLDDPQLWADYLAAQAAYWRASDRVRNACRQPTDAEREERRRVICAHLATGGTAAE